MYGKLDRCRLAVHDALLDLPRLRPVALAEVGQLEVLDALGVRDRLAPLQDAALPDARRSRHEPLQQIPVDTDALGHTGRILDPLADGSGRWVHLEQCARKCTRDVVVPALALLATTEELLKFSRIELCKDRKL